MQVSLNASTLCWQRFHLNNLKTISLFIIMSCVLVPMGKTDIQLYSMDLLLRPGVGPSVLQNLVVSLWKVISSGRRVLNHKAQVGKLRPRAPIQSHLLTLVGESQSQSPQSPVLRVSWDASEAVLRWIDVEMLGIQACTRGKQRRKGRSSMDKHLEAQVSSVAGEIGVGVVQGHSPNGKAI